MGGYYMRAWAICLPLIFIGCTTSDELSTSSRTTSGFPATFARQWMTNLANSVKGDTVKPPVAARTYAYASIAMYEAVVHGMPGYRSLAGQLNGLDSLPVPDSDLEYDWATVLAQTMHKMMLASVFPPGPPQPGGIYTFPAKIFYEYTTVTQAPLTVLGPTQIGFRRADGVPEEVIANSIAYADQLADALTAWANADGYYDVRFAGWIPPTGPDKWVPTGFSDTDIVSNPLEPHFGSLRPLAMTASNECSTRNLGLSPPPFSTEPSSAFYQAADHVRQVGVDLTEEQLIIARYWSDDPGPSSTPAGHWIEITSTLIRNQTLDQAVAAYAYLSIGFLDSFIAVWDTKFDYNLLRPTTFIRRHIDSDWLSLQGTPQFPTYVSGHSGQSGASAELLTRVFGDIPFTDTTKVRRGFRPRTYVHFRDAADEAAASRLYGGIHYQFDNDHGLAVGRCVAAKIIDRVHLWN
jgi:hypothetical protein